MAYVWPHRNRIAIQLKIDGDKRVTTINLKPTKANLEAARRLARTAEHELRAGVDWATVRATLRGEQRRVPAGSLGYYAQHFLDHANVERSTLMGYETLYNRYWIAFDARPIAALLRTELAEHLATFKVGSKTKHNALSVLRLIFAVAKNDRVLTEAPTDDWEISKGKGDAPDPYTEIERDKLLAALDGIALDYFTLAFHTGMRTGELLGLEWSQLEKPYINVAQTRVRRRIKATTKTGDSRRVLVPDLVWKMLDANPTRFRRSFVFLTPEGLPFIDADWLMEKWAKAHGKANVRRRLWPYPWRHTYISLALSRGASLLWVSKQCGHDMVTMQKHYARWIKGRDDADRKELERIYG